jgi:hypothetical protein
VVMSMVLTTRFIIVTAHSPPWKSCAGEIDSVYLLCYSRSNRGGCFFPSSPIARRLVSYPLPASSFLRGEGANNLSISPTPEIDSA